MGSTKSGAAPGAPVEYRLADGAEIFFKYLAPDDKENLNEGFRRLSKESRYKRFFAYKSELSPKELKYFTEIDGVNHVAVAAGHRLPHGTVEGIGVARFVRREQEPDAAEPAIAVVDEWQGKGVGKALLAKLVEAARERGIRRFVGSALADNEAMLAILEKTGRAELHFDGDYVYFEFPLEPDEILETGEGLVRTLVSTLKRGHSKKP